jgi:cytoskeletal protein CcmA (bactofilin family)
MSTTPTRNYEPTPVTSGSATIGKAVMVKGQIFSREDLYIDGDVEGNVELAEHRLTVGPNGKVKAGVKAREIVVLGNIQGNVEATDKVEIRKDARLIGDIKTARIVIEDGAYFKGGIDIIRNEAKPAAAKPAAPAAAQPAQPQPASQPAQPAQPVGAGADSKR